MFSLSRQPSARSSFLARGVAVPVIRSSTWPLAESLFAAAAQSRITLAIVSIVALVAAIATFFLYGAPHVSRAIVQRAMFAEFFAWYAAASLLLLTRRV